MPLENVVEVITKTASKYGLSFIQYPINEENKIGIVTILMHDSGEYMETPPIFVKPSKDDAQGAGSVITYLRRYSLSSIFGITSDIDDDGNESSIRNNLIVTLKEKELKLKKPAEEIYKSVCENLNINKKTSELSDKETVLITKMINKL